MTPEEHRIEWLKAELEKLRKENQRLRDLVIDLGGKP